MAELGLDCLTQVLLHVGWVRGSGKLPGCSLSVSSIIQGLAVPRWALLIPPYLAVVVGAWRL